MQPSPLPVRTHHAFAEEATFQDLVAARLQKAPWLVLSAALHAVMLMLLWVFLPADARPNPTAHVAVELDEAQQVTQPPPEPPPRTEPEVDPEVRPIQDDPVAQPDEAQSFDDASSDSPTKESSFTSDQWNTATGLAGGAAGPYGRRGQGNGKGPGDRGGNPYVEAALTWLAAHQDPDGKWDADGFMKHDDPAFAICGGPGNATHDVGVTGLALLAFLGENNTLRSGPYREVVKRGVMWLRSQQQENGRFGGAASHDFVYDHAIAAYAMCESYGLSHYKLLRDAAQRGIDYLESHRNPYGVWRYQPRDGDNDLSVTGWAIMAYESGKFFGLEVSDAALANAAVFLDQVSDVTGLHGYTKAGECSSRKPGEQATRFPVEKGHAMTAVGLFCRFFLGQDPKERPVMKAAAKLLVGLPPRWDPAGGSIDHYYWYYATYALFQMGGTPWRAWQKELERAVGPQQHGKGSGKNLLGSWDPEGAWGEDGGRVYSTAILALTMQANYRYTRLIR